MTEMTNVGTKKVKELLVEGYDNYPATVLRGPKYIVVVGAHGEVFWIKRPDVVHE